VRAFQSSLQAGNSWLPWIKYGVSPSLDDFKWELYNIIQDFSQANNLAASEPTKFPVRD